MAGHVLMFLVILTLIVILSDHEVAAQDKNSSEMVEMHLISKLYVGLGICTVFVALCCCCSAVHRWNKRKHRQDLPTEQPAETERFVSRRERYVSRRDPPTLQESLLMRQVNSNSPPVCVDLDHSSRGHTNDTLNTSGFNSTHCLNYGASPGRREVSAPAVTERDAGAPPVYEEVAAALPRAQPPPSYKDLFPDC